MITHGKLSCREVSQSDLDWLRESGEDSTRWLYLEPDDLVAPGRYRIARGNDLHGNLEYLIMGPTGAGQPMDDSGHISYASEQIELLLGRIWSDYTDDGR